tara:strand:+ start:14886 stop:15116 length:231 start_codon:yes stop_codon:yes gene_type:complete
MFNGSFSMSTYTTVLITINYHIDRGLQAAIICWICYFLPIMNLQEMMNAGHESIFNHQSKQKQHRIEELSVAQGQK